ncbi:hypothetical protein TRIHO_00480 [Tritonibacter horizontis]|uniref:Uncharacterized protein n=1 Tax=Tritonibacter horizontis TaxID=1768241 RepID=A0A132C391_9RHOB|nr:hypothetical protein TRIHO_00480 [Tritonibacter horizontis]
MGDKDHRHPGFLLQLLHQAEHLRLGGHIQRRGRFIRNQQVRFGDHRHGDHGALAHPAGQLERVGAPGALRVGKTDAFETVQHLAFGGSGRWGPVQMQHFGHLIADPVQRRERAHGFLKDHRDPVAAHIAAHLAFADPGQVNVALGTARQDHPTRVQPCGPRQDAQHRPAADGLARAAFADQRQRFTGGHGKAHIPDHGGVFSEPDAETFDGQERPHSEAPAAGWLRKMGNERSPCFSPHLRARRPV